jgi:hypothetical protein
MKYFASYYFKLLLLIPLFIAPILTVAMDGGGGTGPSFSNAFPGSSSGCGSGSVTNKGASVDSPCHPDNVDAKYCPPKGETAYYADCKYSTGGVCQFDICACWGSMENTIYSQFCAPGTGTYTFEVTNTSCSGGAESLQFQIMSGTSSNSSICDLTVEYCDKGSTSNQTFTVDLDNGVCYTLLFDGNAGSECTWDFNINCTQVLSELLQEYYAKVRGNKVDVSWLMSFETDVDHYEILRSSNGKDFISIGSIKANNNPDIRQSYTFTDENPMMGFNFYRLRQVQKNGKEHNYRMLSAEMRKLDISIYPNPIKNDLNINFGRELMPGTVVKVYDVLGHVVYYKELTERTLDFKIDMNDCTKGLYYLSVSSGDFLIQQKFFKD